MTKSCKKCNIEQPLENYFKDKNNSSGYRSCCKVCFKSLYNDKDIQKLYYRKWFNKSYLDRVENRKKGLLN